MNLFKNNFRVNKRSNESSKRWIKEEEVIDDITAVLIFFED